MSILAAAAGFAVAMLFNHVSTETKSEIEWETLVTGVMALAAATMTVRAMMRSDGMQEERHREAMSLAIRGDVLAAQRAADRAVEFETQIEFRPEISDKNDQGPHLRYPAFAKAVLQWIVEVDREIEHPSIKGASHLFDGTFSLILDMYHRERKELSDAAEALNRLPIDTEPRTWEIIHNDVERAMYNVVQALDEFITFLTDLRKTYGPS